ncbi:MAG: hypothetical protein ACRBCS_08935 [Cellvibrionaceae bacterium]
MKKIIAIPIYALLFLMSTGALASYVMPESIDNSIVISSTGTNSLEKSVLGSWASHDSISFETDGNYTLTVTDLSVPNPFDYLGVVISSTIKSFAAIVICFGNIHQQSLVFDIDSGQYNLDLFALPGNGDLGKFSLSVVNNNPSPVPLPLPVLLFAASIVSLFPFYKKK